MAKGLSPKQARFVAEYLVDLNATQAAIRAGYSVKAARAVASRLLTNANIAQAVADGRDRQCRKVELTAERVKLELARILCSDVRAIIKDGKLKPLHELSDDEAAAIASVEVVTRRRPGEEKVVEYVYKYRLWDKPSIIDKAMKHLGLLKEQVEHSGSVVLQEARQSVEVVLERLAKQVER